MALQAVANRRRVNRALQLGRVLVGVTGKAQRLRGGGDQLYAGYVFVDPNFVAAMQPVCMAE